MVGNHHDRSRDITPGRWPIPGGNHPLDIRQRESPPGIIHRNVDLAGGIISGITGNHPSGPLPPTDPLSGGEGPGGMGGRVPFGGERNANRIRIGGWGRRIRNRLVSDAASLITVRAKSCEPIPPIETRYCEFNTR